MSTGPVPPTTNPPSNQSPGPSPFYGVDPIKLQQLLWPHVTFTGYQKDIIYSVEENDETYVPAANMMGKDFTAGFIALSYFLRHRPVRVITTSVKDEHLDVLWGEIDRYIRTARHPVTGEENCLVAERGGPLIYLHQEIRRVYKGVEEKDSYLKGQVSKKGEGMAGHHAPFTLMIADEASGVDDIVHNMSQGWAKRMLMIGNPNPCTNFFRRGVAAGDLPRVA